MRFVVVFGNTQTTELIRYQVDNMAGYRVVAFTVDREYIISEKFCGLPIVPFDTVQQEYPPTECLMAVQLGTRRANQLRAEKYLSAKSMGYTFYTHVGPRAEVWDGFVAGENTWIGSGTTVEPFSKIGDNVCLTSSCFVGHHSVIGDHCFIGAGAVILGDVRVGSFCFLGANCTVRDHTRVGERCIIDAGMYVKGDLENGRVLINRVCHDLPSKGSNTSGR